MIQSKDIRLVDLKDIKVNPANRNNHSDDQIERLVKIIEYQGFRTPLIVSNRNGMLVAGHGRLMAAKKMKLKQVPVMFQDFTDDNQEYAAMVSDNAIASWSELDLSGINADIGDLGPDFDIDLLGIKGFEIDSDFEPGCDEDEIPEHVEPKTKLGDIYQLGDHRLMCGDSTNIDAVEKLMENQKAGMIFTDPPYGVSLGDDKKFVDGKIVTYSKKKIKNDESTDIYKQSVPVMALMTDGPIYTWFAGTKALALYQAIEDSGGQCHALIIWHKTNATYKSWGCYKQRHEPCLFWKSKNGGLDWAGPSNEPTIWEQKRDYSDGKLHPTIKPVELAERAIKNHSAPTVLDMFGGSGSTLIACEKTNRKCFMMELDPHYCDVIVARWEKYTGRKAELIG